MYYYGSTHYSYDTTVYRWTELATVHHTLILRTLCSYNRQIQHLVLYAGLEMLTPSCFHTAMNYTRSNVHWTLQCESCCWWFEPHPRLQFVTDVLENCFNTINTNYDVCVILDSYIYLISGCNGMHRVCTAHKHILLLARRKYSIF